MRAPSSPNTRGRGAWRPELFLPLAVLAAAAVLQAAIIARAVTPALDAVTHVALAQRITQQGLAATIHHEREQWLFPAWLAVVHRSAAAARLVHPHDWARSAQLAAALPLLLSALAVYALWRQLSGPPVAAGAAALLVLLPEVAALGADGLSDALHLLLATAALACAIPLVDRQSTKLAAWTAAVACGVLLGAAVATRAEAWIILPSLAATLLSQAIEQRTRHAWLHVARSVVGCGLGLTLVVAPWLATSGVQSLADASARLLGRGGLSAVAEVAPLNGDLRTAQAALRVPAAAWRMADGQPMVFGPKDYSRSSRFSGPAAAAAAMLEGLARLLAYGIGLLALWGAATRGIRYRRGADRLLLVTAVLFLLATLVLTQQRGYLVSRHLVLFAVLAVGVAVEGALDLGRRLARGLDRARSVATPSAARDAPARIATLAILGLAMLIAMPRLSVPLHASRGPHRSAAEWLEAPQRQPGAVLDTVGLTALTSGRPTYRGEATAAALCDPRLRYLVLEAHEVEAESPRARSLRQVLAWGARPVASFAAPAATGGQSVRVFAWNPPRLALGRDEYRAR